MGDMGDVFRAMKDQRKEEKNELFALHKRALVDFEEQGAITTEWRDGTTCRVYNSENPALWADIYCTTGVVCFLSGERELPTGISTLLKVLELYPADAKGS